MALQPATLGGLPSIDMTKSLLDQIIDAGKLIRQEGNDPDGKARVAARNLVGEFVDQVLPKTTAENTDITQRITACIAELDARISEQLNAVLHDPGFQKLEAAWRGLNYLVMNTETGTMLKLRLLFASKHELSKDLTSATEFDQSALFKKLYEEEYGTFGGKPYSVLVGDYEFGPSAADVTLLTKISNVAAAAHAPFIAAAAPAMFFMDSFTEMASKRDLAKIFESPDFIDWNGFRDTEDSRYVALTMPRVLARAPWGANSVPVDGMSFEEEVNGPDASKYLWGSAAYKLAQRITNAYSLYGWTAAVRGVEGGGKVEGLPSYVFNAPEGDRVQMCPTEIALTDRREKELNDLGFIALMHCKGTNYAAFFGGQSAQKPLKYISEAANANARLSAMLPYVLTASRFAHYIKSMMRDKVGSFQTKETIQSYLNLWIGQYVLGKDDAGQDLKAKYPLREARVDVVDVVGKPGVYTATVFLRPHFQLEELTASIRLVAELPPPVAA